LDNYLQRTDPRKARGIRDLVPLIYRGTRSFSWLEDRIAKLLKTVNSRTHLSAGEVSLPHSADDRGQETLQFLGAICMWGLQRGRRGSAKETEKGQGLL